MLPHIVSALDILNVPSPTSLPSMLSNCSVNPQDQDNEDRIKLLQVPVWDDKIKTRSILHSTNHDTSLTWSDLLLDSASDHSESLASFWNSTLEKCTNSDNQQQQQLRRRRQSKEQLERIHQVQADSLVEKRFIGQLRQSEVNYTQMRTYYENQLKSLQIQLIDMRCQRDCALGDIEINDRKRKKNSNNKNNNFNTTTNITTSTKLNAKVNQHHRQRPHYHVTRHVKQQHATATATTTTTKLSPPSPADKHITQEIKKIKSHYEGQIRRLTSKNQELERKHTQITHTMSTTRAHAELVVRTLHNKMNQLQTERNQLEQAMKHDNARSRNQLSLTNQETQQLKIKDIIPTIQRIKDHPHQNTTIMKKDTKNYQYIQQINSILRKAAAEGALLSATFTLEKIPDKSITRPAPPPPSTACLQHSPPPSPMGLN